MDANESTDRIAVIRALSADLSAAWAAFLERGALHYTREARAVGKAVEALVLVVREEKD